MKNLCILLGIATTFLAKSVAAGTVPIVVNQPAGGYDYLKFGPMTVATDGDKVSHPLTVFDVNALPAVTELFFCGNYKFGNCAANILLSFDHLISGLTFQAVQTSTLQNFSVWGYSNPLANIATDTPDFVESWNDATVLASKRRLFDLGGMSVSKIYINNTSDHAAFGNFSYNDVAAIPLPAGAALLVGALGAMGVAASPRRRRRA